jgi:hypothetical protein
MLGIPMSNVVSRLWHHRTLTILFIALSLIQLTIMKWSHDAGQEVRRNAEVIEANAVQSCRTRAESRIVIREVMFQFVQGLESLGLDRAHTRLYIEENYPEIDCEQELSNG